jgi:hypothetical protein
VTLPGEKRLAVVHDGVCTHASQGTILQLIIAAAGHEDGFKVVGVETQVVDVPVDHGIMDVTLVDSQVGEVSKDCAEDSENLRHSFGLSKISSRHVILIANCVQANVQRGGNVHRFDLLDKELDDILVVFDVVDEYLLIVTSA